MRMAVARFELTPSMPILARMEVIAANIDEPNANKNHIISSPKVQHHQQGPGTNQGAAQNGRRRELLM